MPLTEDEKRAIAGSDTLRTFRKGELLLREGERSKDGYFVIKGCLRVYYVVEGEEKTTAFFTEMEGITPHSAASGQPSDYYIAAVEDSIVSVGNSDLDAEMFARFPRFETLCRILSEQQLAKNQLSFDRFKTSSPQQRYLDLMSQRPDLLQRVPQHQLASFLGITPQSLSRLRARLATRKEAAF